MKKSNFFQYVILCILWMIIRNIRAHSKNHVCQHDAFELEREIPQEYYNSIKDIHKNRRVQTSTPQPLRVTVDYADLDNSTKGQGMDQTKKDYIEKIMKASQLFLSHFIKVIPRTKPVIKRGKATCLDMQIPPNLQSPGVTDSDLHILVTFENNPTNGGLANAGACDYDPNPIVGRIKFNIGTMTNIGTTPEGFAQDFSTAIHELTHVLGFSGGAMQYWFDPDTGSPYSKNVSKIQVKGDARGVPNVTQLKSKNVLETARRYFNCPTLDALPLENQGGTGSFGSHWERDLIQNEYMTASAVIGHAVISEFTAALLMDTGFYAQVNMNMVEKTYWGRNKGCEFISLSCDNPNQQYPEFYYGDKDKCDFYQTGFGSSSNDDFSQFKFTQNYSNAECYDTINNKSDAATRSTVGPGSKCFSSTALDKRYNAPDDAGTRCHKYTCNSDNTVINVNLWQDSTVDIKATCNSPKQVIDLTSKDTKGQLICPSDFDLFCNFPRSCINFCNGNGVCTNSVCYCLEGFAGEDCSKSCPIPQVWDGTKCVLNCSAGTFLNPDNTCKTTCPKAYFKNSNSNICSICEKTCSSCTGATNSECSECNSPYILKGTSCVEPSKTTITCDSTCLTCSGPSNNECLTCAEGKFLDSTKKCIICQSPCKSCEILATKCLSCIVDYTYQSSNNICSPNCDSTCMTCSQPNNASKCITCKNGYFISSGQCLSCTAPCATCSDSATKCFSCNTNYNYDSSLNTCNPVCDTSCKTCLTPVDATSCSSCNSGYYLSSGKCLICSPPCSKCITAATQCTECISDYSLISGIPACSPICHSSCKTCQLPKNPQKCSSCSDGFYLDPTTSECKQCTSPCATCVDSSVACLTCVSTKDYSYDKNKKSCLPICHSTCKTCSKPNDENACNSCDVGRYLNNEQCLNCKSPCETCETSSTKCLACIANYKFDSTQNSCLSDCDNSCKTCSAPHDSSKCLDCFDGFFISNGVCQKCSSPCSKCINNNKQCTECINKTMYDLDMSKNQCIPKCHATCKECSNPLDDSQCTSCTDRFFLDNGYCKKCQSPCTYCNNNTYCTTCETGYISDGKGNCIPQCHSSCLTCSKPNDANYCLTCNNKLFLNKSQQCTSCSQPCENCQDSANKCLSCIPNYKLDSSLSQCFPICDSSCKTCFEPYNASKCLTCEEGFYLSQNSCKKCQQPCKNCEDSSTKCLSCIDNTFNYDRIQFKCTSNCHPSCKACNNPLEINCTACFDSYYYDQSSSQCKVCQSPCENCIDSQDKCTSCTSGYTLVGNKCIKYCHSSCKTCVSPNDPDKCSSCEDGFYLMNGKCSTCSQQCQTCEQSSFKCLSCKSNYTFNSSSNTCIPMCHPSCATCMVPNNPNSCLSCLSNSYVNKTTNQCLLCPSQCLSCTSDSCLSCQPQKILQNGSCLDCLEGFFFYQNKCLACIQGCQKCSDSSTCEKCHDNYLLNDQHICEQPQIKKTCHFTCDSCIGSSYSECTSCGGDRVLAEKYIDSYEKKQVGICNCPSGTSDLNSEFCEQSNIQEIVKTTTTAFFISSGVTATILSFVSANPFVIVSLIEFSQTISFFTYVNERPILGFDDVAQNLYVSHLTKIFNFGSLSNQQKNKNLRYLQSITSQNQQNQSLNRFNNNTKIPLNDKYPEFVINSLSILVLSGFSWFLSAIFNAITPKDQNSLKAKLRKIFCISLPICIFVLTSQEFSLLIFYQFQQLSLDSSVDSVSAVLSFIILFYLIGFIGYLFYKLNYKKVLTQQITSNVTSNNAKILPVMEKNETDLPNSPQPYTKEQYQFYVINLYIKQNSFLNRAFIQIIVIRKMITSLILTYGFQDAVFQMGILFAFYLIYWIYIIISQPFIETKHRIIYTVIETITLVMHILYLILLCDHTDNYRQKILSLTMLVLIMITLLIYVVISIVYLGIFLLRLLQKCRQSENTKVVDVSQHLAQNQSNIKLKEPISPNYNNNHMIDQQKKQSTAIQDKINLSEIHNHSILFENQPLQNTSKSHIQETVVMESPQREIRLQQQSSTLQNEQSQQQNHIFNNQIRLIQKKPLNDRFKPQDDFLPEVISRHNIPQIFIEEIKSPSSIKPSQKFKNIF